MSKKFKTIITTAGAEKLAAATVPGGKKVNLTAMAVGDGGGTLPEPDAGQTKLINEVWRHALNKISQDNKNKNYIVAELVIPPDVGGFWMRELGLYDDAGTLIAVANMAESYKPKLAEGSGRAQTCRMVIIVSDVDSVALSIDTTTVMATQDYVDDKLAEHEQSRRHPDATLKEKGFVQLSSATDSASESHAATPKAVKAAYDLANGKYTAQDASTAQKGIVQLSSATDSNDEGKAATQKAVKIAMDNANARLAKERNGGDIPNKPLFVQNIGLQETVNKADGALQKGQNLNDVADRAKARAALQLGTVATLDVTTSATDNIQGHVLKVGDRGIGLTAINYVGIDFNSYKFAAGETLFLRMADCTNIPAGIDTGYVVYAYVNVIGIRNVNNNVAVLIGDNGGAKYYWAVRSTNSSGVTTWSVKILPQSATDISAQALSYVIYGISSGKTDFNSSPAGQTSYVYADATGAPPESAVVIDYWGGFTTQRVQIAVASASGRTYTRVYNGKAWTDWDPIYSVKYKPPYPVRSVNGKTGDVTIPAPDLSPYATKNWVLQNFVQNIDLTAPAEVGFWDGRGYMRPTDGAAMYNFNMVGGSSNVGNFIIRYMRKQVNNTWYVIN
ncbi:phage tail protein [Citrobacter braakii]|uniref:phage tail-collar fiber domain-containing protein n=1 Tax=Citrobacter braakii TaxID=57706 RepID=UPI002DB8FE6D|nr:phage tail protein [Citrobacter braakii]MEB8219245.1 phage tail protein [Citrobacter braakii]MEB8302975.1 phage tail protein [Citrobacter braakii]